MGILKNSWVIGLVTGICSSLFVFFITNFLFDNKRKRDYVQHKKEANTEIVNALKPYIAEQGLPEHEVLFSLIKSTSRKYNVNSKDLFTPYQICEELVREILVDVYISSEKKKEFTENVVKYRKSISKVQDSIFLEEDKNVQEYDFYNRKRFRLLLIAGSLTVIMGVIGSLMAILTITNPELAKTIWFFPALPKEDVENAKFVSDILFEISLVLAVSGIGTISTLIMFYRQKKKSSRMFYRQKKKSSRVGEGEDLNTVAEEKKE